jgi:hypothetical protein
LSGANDQGGAIKCSLGQRISIESIEPRYYKYYIIYLIIIIIVIHCSNLKPHENGRRAAHLFRYSDFEEYNIVRIIYRTFLGNFYGRFNTFMVLNGFQLNITPETSRKRVYCYISKSIEYFDDSIFHNRSTVQTLAGLTIISSPLQNPLEGRTCTLPK